MKVTSIGLPVICLAALTIVSAVSAQGVDPRCTDVFDKVACQCAMENGGRIIPAPVGVKREGLKLRPREEQESMQTLDGGRVAFRSYFRREGMKVHRSRAVEGYLACLRRNGRK
jgi:hypothetical protein